MHHLRDFISKFCVISYFPEQEEIKSKAFASTYLIYEMIIKRIVAVRLTSPLEAPTLKEQQKKKTNVDANFVLNNPQTTFRYGQIFSTLHFIASHEAVFRFNKDTISLESPFHVSSDAYEIQTSKHIQS